MSKASNFVLYGSYVGLISPVVWILLIAIMGQLYPDYSHLKNFISDLGAIEAPHSFVQRINFFQFGIGNVILALALYKGLGRRSVPILILQMIIGTGIFLSGIFPGHSSNPHSHESFLHNLVGIPIFLTIVLTPFVSGLIFRKIESWRDLAPYSMIMTPVLLALLFLMIRAVQQSGFPGLYQRLLLGIWIVWMVLISRRLYTSHGPA